MLAGWFLGDLAGQDAKDNGHLMTFYGLFSTLEYGIKQWGREWL